MTDPTAHSLIQRLADALESWSDDDVDVALILEARAYLAQPKPEAPTDEELLELMPETMRDEFSYAAKVCSDATDGKVRPGIFRVVLNTAALEYARAILTRYGQPWLIG